MRIDECYICGSTNVLQRYMTEIGDILTGTAFQCKRCLHITCGGCRTRSELCCCNNGYEKCTVTYCCTCKAEKLECSK